MEFSQESLMDVFLADAVEYATTAEQIIMHLEEQPGDKDALASLFRAIHTLKGDAGIVEVAPIAKIAHHMEDYLDAVRNAKAALDEEAVSALLGSLDVVKTILAALKAGKSAESVPSARAITDLQYILMPERIVEEEDKQADAGPATSSESSPARTSTLRVDISKLDDMLGILGDIVARRAAVNRDLNALGELGEPVLEAQTAVDRLHSELHELILRLRMVPIEPVLGRYHRTVRDVAKDQGKVARLCIEAGGVDVDTSVVDRLREPLTHLVRNAVHHGLEPPAEREAAGKKAVGTITISAHQEMSHLVIKVSDDGRGIDRDEVLRAARSKKIIDDENHPDDEQLLELVFHSGLTTAGNVTDVSGRGVGMDAVTKSVQSLRGTVSINSSDGEGTTFTLRIPLTLARGFAVDVSEGTYVLPLESVTECMPAPAEMNGDTRLRGVMPYREGILPYVRLRSFFDVQSPAAQEDIVIVRHAGILAGLIVDRLHGEVQTAAQPLHHFLEEAKAISGASVLEDGTLALLIDVSEAIRIAGARSENGRSRPTESNVHEEMEKEA